MKAGERIILYQKVLLVVLLVLLLIPTTSYAASNKNVCNIVYSNGTYYGGGGSGVTGKEDDPVELSLNYDEIVVAFGSNAASSKFELPFCFKVVSGGSGMKYAKYQITVLDVEKKVIFKRLAASNNLEDFKVTPNKKVEGYNYVQPGAIYNDNFTNMGFRAPFYKIEATIKFNGNKKIEGVLGNSTLNTNNSIEANKASNPQVYVLCVDGLSESETIKFSSGQVSNKATVVVKEEDPGVIFSDDNVKKYLVQSSNSIKDMTMGGSTYSFSGGTTEVIYNFWGVTSEILNDNETNAIEGIIAKVLISIGSVFRAIVTAVGGPDLTIDALIFNQYENTILDFWGGNGTYVDLFTAIINGWFGAFRSITAFVLVIVLVAMGVRAILLSGTPNQKKISDMFVGWIIAVALLYFGPYFLKYAVTMNDTFVDALRSSSKYSIYSVYNTDFLNKYDLENNMQLAEDSEIVKVEDMLMKLYSKIEEELENNTEELEEAERKIERFNNSFIMSTFYEDTRVVEVRPGGAEISRKIRTAQTIIKRRINEKLNKGETVDEEAVREIVGTVATRIDNAPGGLLAGADDITDALLEYSQAYAKKLELESDLRATETAIALANKGIDLESTMKVRAGETRRVIYVLVWFILIYQLVVLLFIYYKRLVIVGVLIVIYPLAVMVYAIEKLMGIDKPKSFKTWMSEYLVNVFVQTVHALVYIMLVEAGLRVYEDDEDNWLLFLIAVLAIFPMESVIRSLMGMKSQSAEAKDRLNLKKMLGYGIALSGAKKVIGTEKQVEAAYAARAAEIAKKQAKQDKNRAFGRKVMDNATLKFAKNDSQIAAARARIAERDARRAKADKERAKKRERARKRLERNKNIAKWTQGVRNVAAVSDGLTTAAAMGFDASDFSVGFSTAGWISGKSKNVKVKKDNSEVKTPVNDRQRADYVEDMATRRNKKAMEHSGETGSNVDSSNSVGGGTGTPQSGVNPIVHSQSRGGSNPIQDKFRSQLGVEMPGGENQIEVSVDSPDYTFTENNE